MPSTVAVTCAKGINVNAAAPAGGLRIGKRTLVAKRLSTSTTLSMANGDALTKDLAMGGAITLGNSANNAKLTMGTDNGINVNISDPAAELSVQNKDLRLRNSRGLVFRSDNADGGLGLRL